MSDTRQRNTLVTNYVYLIPVFLLLGLFVYYSVFYTLGVSMLDWDGLSSQRTFVGAKNFQRLLSDPVFYKAIRNTFVFMSVTVSVQMIIGFTTALLLTSKVKLKAVYRVVVFIPVVLSVAIIATVFRRLLNAHDGQINLILRGLGLDVFAVEWLSNPRFALLSLTGINIWQWTGLSFILYVAGMSLVESELYEAAMIEGAGIGTIVTKITLPLLRSTHVSLITLGVIGGFKTFDLVWLTTRGGPLRSTEFVSTYIYKNAILDYQAGYAASLSIVLLIIVLGLTVVNLNARKSW